MSYPKIPSNIDFLKNYERNRAIVKSRLHQHKSDFYKKKELEKEHNNKMTFYYMSSGKKQLELRELDNNHKLTRWLNR